MITSQARYQHNPLSVDTTGFYDYSLPVTNPGLTKVADSLTTYYDLGRFVYVQPRPEKLELRLTKSIFSGHQLKAGKIDKTRVSGIQTDWILVLLLISTALLAWVRFSYPKRLTQIFRAVAQQHHVNQLEREGNLFGERITVGLILVYLIAFSLFLFLIADYFGVNFLDFKNYQLSLMIMAGLIAYHLIKMLIISQLGIIFDSRTSSHFHQLNLLLFNLVTGIFLLPVCYLAAYHGSLAVLVAGLAGVGFLLIYRLLRTAIIGISNKDFNLFYLFLYLCTLEILPLAILLRVVLKS